MLRAGRYGGLRVLSTLLIRSAPSTIRRDPTSSSTRISSALRVAAVALAIGLATFSCPSSIGASASSGAAGSPGAYRDRPLIEVLRDLQKRGLNLIFTTAVVPEELRVTVEPRAAEPRALLDEILAPLGLEARDGAAGSILIVRSRAEPERGAVSGRILSKEAGTPVGRASIFVGGTDRHGTSLADGSFDLRGIPPGTYDVVVEATGFLPASYQRVRVAAGTPVNLTVALERQPRYLAEIVVMPGRLSLVREEQMASLTVRGEGSLFVPTIGGDVSRIVELLPGVASPDQSAAFNLRGAEPEDVAMILDGLELYEPFHLTKFQSPFSLVDSEIIDSIDVIAGGYTADLGDRIGGFVRMATGAPIAPYRTRLQLGSLNSRFAYEGRTARGPWFASVRAWYPEAFRDTISLGEEGVHPRFEDAYLKVPLGAPARTALSIHGLVSHDELELEKPGNPERVDAVSRNAYLWLRGLGSWSEGWESETVLSAGQIKHERSGVSETDEGIVAVEDDRSVVFGALKHDSSWELSGAQLLKGGAEVRWLGSRYRYTLREEDGGGAETARRLSPSSTTMGVYVAHRARLTESLATEVGVRWDRQTHTEDSQISPRLNGLWRPSERSEMRLGLGRYAQSQRIDELRVEDGLTEFRPAERSTQAELMYQHALPGGALIRFDAYERRLRRVNPRSENLFTPIDLFPETEDDRVVVAPRRARLRGAEILLRSESGKRIYGWVGYAWSSATDRIDGRDVPRSWDQTHAARFLVGYRPGERWSLSLSGAWHTGWPTTPVTAQRVPLPGGGTEIAIERGDRNSERYPAYARFDVKAGYAAPLPRGRIRLDAEIVNVTDRDNACCVAEFQFETRPDGSVRVRPEFGSWLGITPSFSVTWEF